MLKEVSHLLVFVLSFLCVSVQAAETVTYYHHDALGSTVAATDESGNLLWREDYRPYGGRIRNPANTDNNLWYTGKPEEAQLGLQYFGARWYDPNMGRFTGIDPAGFNQGNIHSFNAYAYTANNPYRYIDPDGRDLVEVFADLNINTGTPGPQWKVNMVKGIWAAYAITPLLVVVPELGAACAGTQLCSSAAIGYGISATANDLPSISTNKKPVVIGENMKDRVIPYAREKGADWYKTTPKYKKNYMKRNKKFITKAMKDKREIIDLGIDKSRNKRSKYYGLEKKMIEQNKYEITKP